jgi:hypothetical protein
VGARLLLDIQQNCAPLHNILTNDGTSIDTLDGMTGYESLVGLDRHPYSNTEQGLATAFSRKKMGDPYTRLVEIIYIRCTHA